ncbi:DUF4142 domain-containing protein [Allorhizobium undicola]|uniref:DUF4142 domain-containing protein n=1 Tax=Allorhizobium undicola TaxID=78527 RepID=UPI0006888A78|nr:DUF4142 domain-containing protein [Allorhizobium undicola]
MIVRPLVAAAGLIFSTASFAQQTMPASPPAAQMPAASSKGSQQALAPTPKDFALQAAAGNLFEIQSAALAEKRAVSVEIKAFAHQISKDHQQAQQDLKRAAKDENITLPKTLPAELQDKLKALEASTDQFDAAFLSAQVSAHEQTLALLQAYSDKGEKGALKTYAIAQTGTIRMHLVKAQNLATK